MQIIILILKNLVFLMEKCEIVVQNSCTEKKTTKKQTKSKQENR